MSNLIRNLSHTLFISVNIGLAVVGLVALIWGLSSHNYHKTFWTGGFVGGWIPTLGLSAIFYAAMGLYGALRYNRTLLIAYGYLAAASLLSRILTWVVAGAHNYSMSWYIYFGVVVELILIIATYLKTHVNITVVTNN